MSKLIKQTTGYLSKIEKAESKQKYSKHLNIPGLIFVYESHNKCPKNKFVYLFYDNDCTITYFHTSCGNVSINDKKINFFSDNSGYEFVIDEKCLDETKKKEILLNIYH